MQKSFTRHAATHHLIYAAHPGERTLPANRTHVLDIRSSLLTSRYRSCVCRSMAHLVATAAQAIGAFARRLLLIDPNPAPPYLDEFFAREAVSPQLAAFNCIFGTFEVNPKAADCTQTRTRCNAHAAGCTQTPLPCNPKPAGSTQTPAGRNAHTAGCTQTPTKRNPKAAGCTQTSLPCNPKPAGRHPDTHQSGWLLSH